MGECTSDSVEESGLAFPRRHGSHLCLGDVEILPRRLGATSSMNDGVQGTW